MRPIEFAEMNATLAKDQAAYRPLPVFVEPEADGAMTSCWALSLRERLRVLVTGRIWLTVLTFNKPQQPVILRAEYPFQREEPQPKGRRG